MKRKISIQPWLFMTAAVAFDEMMLHWWTAQTMQLHRIVTVFTIALAFGLSGGLLLSLIARPQWAKRAAVTASSVLTVVYFGFYVIFDTYREFLSPGTIFSGAGGVAADYLGIAVTAVMGNLWRLGVLAIPVVSYGLFGRAMTVPRGFRPILTALCGAVILLSVGTVRGFGTDMPVLDAAYRFDSAVRSFGLDMGMVLEAVHGLSGSTTQPEFLPTEENLTEPPQTQTETTEPVTYELQTLPLDFGALANSEADKGIRALHTYVAEQEAASKNEFTGLFAGKNLIFITAEAFSLQVIDPVRTPTLYRLAEHGIRFQEYYQPAWGGSTTAGEFSNLLGLIPEGGKCMDEVLEQDMFFTIGAQLQKRGYHSTAYHNHSYTYYNRDETHTRLGYDAFLAMGNGMEAGVKRNVPESDLEMMEYTVAQYLEKKPFSIYYMTMSGHALYSRSGNAMSRKNYHRVEELSLPEAVKCYLAANLELEDAMSFLLRQLEDAGIAEDTVIVLATDHYPYALEKGSAWGNEKNYLEDLYGTERVDCFTRDRSALIIWSGGIEGEGITVEEPVCSLDILPTLLNLFDIPYDSRLLAGRDVFSDARPLVLWPDHSWRAACGFYDASSGRFTPQPGEQADEKELQRIHAVAANKISYCEGVRKYNYFNTLAPLVK